nr:MAG TPA: hypothetical protein [Caudoviricetes sp.]
MGYKVVMLSQRTLCPFMVLLYHISHLLSS